MENTNQIQEIKNRLIKDLTDGITYMANRQSDIYTMMDTYKSDFVEQEQKENILKNLANCINGLPYSEPLRLQKPYYTHEDVDKLGQILDNLIENLPTSYDQKKDCDKFWEEIHALNESKEYGLLDTWRRETIQELMNEACEAQEETQTFGMQMM